MYGVWRGGEKETGETLYNYIAAQSDFSIHVTPTMAEQADSLNRADVNLAITCYGLFIFERKTEDSCDLNS